MWITKPVSFVNSRAALIFLMSKVITLEIHPSGVLEETMTMAFVTRLQNQLTLSVI